MTTRRKPTRRKHRTGWLAALSLACFLTGCDQIAEGMNDGANDDQPQQSYQPNMGSGVLQQPLQPVDLQIQNLQQQTPVWCWVTVAQQIIAATKGMQNTPQQCELVATANGADASVCCGSYNQQCVRTGSLQQIAGLIQQYGGRTSSFAAPTDPMTLYNALRSGHAVIIAIDAGNGAGHVVVARGMMTVPTNGGYEPMIILNDPMAQFTQPVPYRAIAPIWREAIVVN